MIERYRNIFVILIIATFSFAAKADHIPGEPPKIAKESNLFIRAIAKTSGNVSLLSDISFGTQTIGVEKILKTYLIGSYYQSHDTWRFGLFYRKVYGELYDEDWLLRDGRWEWSGNRGRSENQIILDVSPRFPVWFLEPNSALFEIKTRLIQSDLSAKRALSIRPGLQKFIQRNSKPWLSLNASVEFLLPLNYGERLLNRFWIYLGGTLRITDSLDIALNAAYDKRFWDSTSQFRADTNESFAVPHASLTAGLGLIFRFGI